MKTNDIYTPKPMDQIPTDDIFKPRQIQEIQIREQKKSNKKLKKRLMDHARKAIRDKTELRRVQK